MNICIFIVLIILNIYTHYLISFSTNNTTECILLSCICIDKEQMDVRKICGCILYQLFRYYFTYTILIKDECSTDNMFKMNN